MTKLKYPKNGLYKLINPDLEDLSKCLSSSIGVSNFIVPEEYIYKKYLIDLSQLLNECLKENNEIIKQVINTTKEMETLDIDLNDEAKKIDTRVMKDLDRMIY